MKEDLIELINQAKEIESHFHPSGGYLDIDMISDVPEFQDWKEELLFEFKSIPDVCSDGYIKEIIKILSGKLNSYQEHKDFNILKAKLKAVRKNIDQYFPMESTQSHVEGIMQKQPKIFISHSSQDKEQAKKLVTLFEQMGLNEDQIFCSSVPGYDIGIDGDIFEGIKQQFSESELHLVYLLSGHYYDSAVSLNEMGAAWIVQAKYTLILLPGFNFEQIKGVVNKNQIGIKLDNSRDEVKDKLNQLYDNIVEEFKLQKKKQIIWEEKRDSFIDEINR